MAGLNVLVAGGDDFGYHDFGVIGEAFYSFLEKTGYHVTLSRDCSVFLADNIRNFDVIICYMNKKVLQKEEEEGLLDSIIGSPWGNTGKPKGFIGIHTAACAFPGSEAYHRMLGCRFLIHPEMGDELQIKVKKREHPVMKNIDNFTIIDELYLLEVYPPFTTLLSCYYNNFEQPLGWVKPYGLGRVFYLGLGHGVEQIGNPNFKKIIVNAIDWSVKHQI